MSSVVSLSNQAEEERIIAMAMTFLGRRSTARKRLAAQINGRSGGRPRGSYKPLEAIKCTCGGCIPIRVEEREGATLPLTSRSQCSRYRAMKRRLAASV
jgi:hypothetical protein